MDRERLPAGFRMALCAMVGIAQVILYGWLGWLAFRIFGGE